MTVRFNPFWKAVLASSDDMGNAFVSSWVGAMMVVPVVFILRFWIDDPWPVFVGAVVAALGTILFGLYATGGGIEFERSP